MGRLVEHLKAIGQHEDTLIVFMADNGAEGNSISSIADTREWVAQNFDNSLENMGRRNSYTYTGPSWAQVSTLPFKWYKGFSTEGGVRCPSIISCPPWKHNYGKVNRDFISVMDLAPTFLELAQIEHPGEEYQGRKIYLMDGISLLSWLEGKEKTTYKPNAAHCWELYGRKAVRMGDWKAEWQDSPYGDNAWELYNLGKDIGEQDDLALEHPEKLQELVAEWDNYANEYNLTLPNEKVGYGPDDFWRDK